MKPFKNNFYFTSLSLFMKINSFFSRFISVTTLVFVLVLVGRAGFSDSIQVSEIDAEAFPRIVAKLTGEDLKSFSVKHIQVSEAGKINHGPMVYLPPAPPPHQIDLFIVLDHSGNTVEYAEGFKLHLKTLMNLMQEEGLDLKIYLSSFSANDSPMEQMPLEWTEAEAWREHLKELEV